MILSNKETMKKLDKIKSLMRRMATLNESSMDGVVQVFDMSINNDREYVRSHLDEIWNLLTDAYSKYNGFKGLQSKKEIMRKCSIVKMVTNNGKIIAAALYNDYLGGNKCIGIGATCEEDLHKLGVEGVRSIVADDIIKWDEYYWVEASDEMENMYREGGGFNVKNKYAEEILNRAVKLCEDDYHYTRVIDGVELIKTIFGFKDEDLVRRIQVDCFEEFNEFMNKQKNRIISYNKMQNEDYQRGIGDITEIEYSKIYVDTCLYYHNDKHINEFPQYIINDLKYHIERIKTLLKNGQYDTKKWKRDVPFEVCIEDGEELLKYITPITIYHFDGNKIAETIV